MKDLLNAEILMVGSWSMHTEFLTLDSSRQVSLIFKLYTCSLFAVQ